MTPPTRLVEALSLAESCSHTLQLYQQLMKPRIQKEHRLNGMEQLTNWYAPQKGPHNNRIANLYRELPLPDNGDRDATSFQFAGNEGLHYQRSCK
jgi:hypothetical protein